MKSNDDVRNGRTVAHITIDNYPEHLNPFYEDESHKHLRFWKVNEHKKGKVDRTSSFSLNVLKEMWAFRSFRLKDKSSALEKNKTSESPPEQRRNISNNEPTFCKTYIFTSPNIHLQKHIPTRNSYQNESKNKNGSEFIRNERSRSTMHTISSSVSKTLPSFAKPFNVCEYRGFLTPQPVRNGNIRLFQNSVINTNPFDTIDDVYTLRTKESLSAPMRREPRKKRRAPLPPPSMPNSALEESSSPKSTASHDSSQLPGQFHQDGQLHRSDQDASDIETEIKSHAEAANNIDLETTCEAHNQMSVYTKEIIKIEKLDDCFQVQDVNVKKHASYNNLASLDSKNLKCSASNNKVSTECSLMFRNAIRSEKKSNVLKSLACIETKISLNPSEPTEYDLLRITEEDGKEKKLFSQEPCQPLKGESYQHLKSFENQAMKQAKKRILNEKTEEAVELLSRSSTLHDRNGKNVSIDRTFHSEQLIGQYIMVSQDSHINFSGVAESSKNSKLTPTLNKENFSYDDGINNNTILPSEIQKKAPTALLMTKLLYSRKKSVDNVLESINRSQRLLNAVVKAEDNSSFPQNKSCIHDFKTLDDTQSQIREIFRKISIMKNIYERKPVNTLSELKINDLQAIKDITSSTENLEKNFCEKAFKKSVNDEDQHENRESSPTKLNLDWNPVPKPKRTKSISLHKLSKFD